MAAVIGYMGSPPSPPSREMLPPLAKVPGAVVLLKDSLSRAPLPAGHHADSLHTASVHKHP